MAAIAAAVLPLASAAAAGPAAPGVTPVQPGPDGYFEYTLRPGSSASGAVVVQNQGRSPTTYAVYAADATTSPGTGVAYGEEQSGGEGPAAWLRLSTPTVSLGPGQKTTVTFTVTVPPGAQPGQHVAAIGAQTPSATGTAIPEGSGSVALVTNARVVIAVVVDVPGPAAVAVRLGHPRVRVQEHRRQLIAVPMSNTGGLMVKPVLAGVVRPCGGGARGAATIHRHLDTLVPGTSIEYPWYLNTVLPAGCYTADVQLMVPGEAAASYRGPLPIGPAQAAVTQPGSHLLWTIPLSLAVADVIALATAVSAAVFVVLRRRRHRAADRVTV